MKATAVILNLRGQAAKHIATQSWIDEYDYNAIVQELKREFGPKAPSKNFCETNSTQNQMQENSETKKLHLEHRNTNHTNHQTLKSENNWQFENLLHRAEQQKHRIPGEIQCSRIYHGASGADKHHKIQNNLQFETEIEFQR